jgi:hypothetical protein
MVELKAIKYGLDINGDSCRIAQCSAMHGRNMVENLWTNSADSIQSETFNGELFFSVNEKASIIKRIKLPRGGGVNIEKIAYFELMTSLPDSISNYYLESYQLDGRPERLAVAYHRHIVDDQISFLEGISIKPAGFKLRAISIAAGYLHYCHHAGGELICLIDISANEISYCFLYEKYPISIGSLVIRKDEHNFSNNGNSNIIIDLSATIQYQTALLFSSGYSVPLSLIILSGSAECEELIPTIEKSMHVKTALPGFRKELFAPEFYDKACQYLVSLGLTANI